MAKIKLTQRTVETLKAPATGRSEYRDEFLANFVLRVTAAGRKTYTYLYRFQGEQKRAEIGTFPPLTLGEARDMARQIWAEIQRGSDPQDTLPWLKNRQAEGDRGGLTQGPFSEMCRRYLDDRRSSCARRHIGSTRGSSTATSCRPSAPGSLPRSPGRTLGSGSSV
jgi:hypothetical protein